MPTRRPITPVPGDNVSMVAYPGEYVAIDGNNVIVHSPSAVEFTNLVKRLGARGATLRLTRVPKEDEVVAVGLG